MNILDKYLYLVMTPPKDSLLYLGQYNIWYVLLSVGIAIFAAYTALFIADFAARANQAPRRNLLLVIGGLALGCGVWSMHFVGMLGFSLPFGVNYNPWVTAFSTIPVMFASIFSLHVISRPHLNTRLLIIGGTLFGAGVGLMHYAGMAAMRMQALLLYDLKLFLMSILGAVFLAIVALWIRSGLSRIFPRLGQWALLPVAAMVMGGAIAGMHYTAMQAAYFVQGGDAVVLQVGIDPIILGIIIISATSLVIGLALMYVFLMVMQEMEATQAERLKIELELKASSLRMQTHATTKSFLMDLSSELQQAKTVVEFAQVFMQQISAQLEADYGVLYLFDEDGAHLQAQVAHGISLQNLASMEIDQGLLGQCAKTKVPIEIFDTQQMTLRIVWGGGAVAPKLIMLVPVLQAERLLGVLVLAMLRNMSQDQRALLEAALSMAAMSLENLMRHLDTERQTSMLQETEAWYRSVIDTAPGGMMVVNALGEIILASRGLETMFGYAVHELLGKSIEILVPKSIHTKHIALRNGFMQDNDNRAMGQKGSVLRGVRRNGTEFMVGVGLSRIPGFAHHGPCVCASIRDLTENDNTQEA